MIRTAHFPSHSYGESSCSVCEHDQVYFECADRWLERVEVLEKTLLVCHTEIKRYCRECFKEYGGSEDNYV
jgi:hypothetical protein